MPQGNVDLTFRVKGHKGTRGGIWSLNPTSAHLSQVLEQYILLVSDGPKANRSQSVRLFPSLLRNMVSRAHVRPRFCSPFPHNQRRWPDHEHPNNTTPKSVSLTVVGPCRDQDAFAVLY